MDDVADFDSENQWLIDLLKEAATTDGAGSDSQLLIECIGRYEDPDGDGDISDGSSLAYKAGLPKSSWYTYSYHADWIRNNYSKIYVKADWEVELVDGYYEITIQPYVSHRPDDGFDNWQCNFVRRQYSVPIYLEIDYEDDGGSTYTYVDVWFGNSNKDSDGNERWPDVSASSGASGTSDAAEADVIEQITPDLMYYLDSSRRMGLSGWQNIEPPDEDSLSGLLGGSWHTKRDDSGVEISYKVFTAKLYGEHTDDDQVYSCQFTAKVPADIKLKVNKSIANKSGYSSDLFGLPGYKLGGTKFYIYTSSTGGTPIDDSGGNTAILTILGDEGGLSNEVKLEAKYANQKVYLEEILPDTAIGYKKPTGRFEITLPAAGQSRIADIENVPLNDPVSIIIRKKSNLNQGNWIGTPDRGGIEYTLEYYTDKSCTSLNRTWKFKTNSNGEINFRQDNPTSGTPFTRNGSTIYPIGWYKLYESTSETELQNRGLEKCLDVYYIEVKDNGSDDGISTVYTDSSFTTEAGHVWGNGTTDATIYQMTNNTYGVIEPEHWEPFAFAKKDIHLSSGKPEGDTKLEGAVFTVYSEDANRFGTSTEYDGNEYKIVGNVVYVNNAPLTITIDPDGRGICKYPLPKTDNTIGKRFYITETTAPLGYKANDVKYYVDFQNRITVKDYNDNTISLSIKNMGTGTTSNETEIYSITYGANNLNVNEVSVPYVNGTAYNTPRKGIIEIEKFDDDYGAVRNKYFFVQFAEKI